MDRVCVWHTILGREKKLQLNLLCPTTKSDTCMQSMLIISVNRVSVCLVSSILAYMITVLYFIQAQHFEFCSELKQWMNFLQSSILLSKSQSDFKGMGGVACSGRIFYFLPFTSGARGLASIQLYEEKIMVFL